MVLSCITLKTPNALPAQILDANMHAPDVQRRSVVLSCALAIIVAGSFSAITAAEGRLLQKTVEFTGEITFLEHKEPGLVIGAERKGERAIAGFGTTSTGSSAVPDGKTIFRIGSVTKAFTGAVLASTAVEGTIALTDRLEQHANGVTGASPLIGF